MNHLNTLQNIVGLGEPWDLLESCRKLFSKNSTEIIKRSIEYQNFRFRATIVSKVVFRIGQILILFAQDCKNEISMKYEGTMSNADPFQFTQSDLMSQKTLTRDF